MRQTVLTCAFLLSLLLVGCEKGEEPTPEARPYWIMEGVNDLTMRGDEFLLDIWDTEHLPDIAVETFYRGSWSIYLEGHKYTLRSHKEKYEQLCLEWGVRFDCGEVESDTLANIPYKVMDYVLCNHGITGMDLITESDFDTDHSAGSSLADITTVGFRSWEGVITGSNNPSIEDVSILKMTDVDASTFPRIYPALGIQITRNPEKAGTYVFQQYIYFADGKVVKRRFKRVWLEEHLALDPTENIN